MSDPSMITQLLAAAPHDEQASGKLLEAVYDQLHAIARKRMSGERRDHTLQATALVSEAYLKLVGGGEVTFQGRTHFFNAAAEAMRRILIDHARQRGRQKRGGAEAKRAPLNVVDLAATGDQTEILAVDDAIHRLTEQDPRLGEIVRLRFYAGLGTVETAELLGVSERTLRREWEVARAFLKRALTDAETR